MTIKVPPIKSQGIKTKLVPFIRESIEWNGDGRWIEPFMGSGVVGFNMRPKRALMADNNPHLINFFNDIKAKNLTAITAREYLTHHGSILLEMGEAYYYQMREKFNESPTSLNFLFLNRSCFNGMIRFNKKGYFNVPFCRKPERFRPAYITKIVNQIDWVAKVIEAGDYEFVSQDWRKTLEEAKDSDFVYLDPPYNARHADYFNSWSEEDNEQLAIAVRNLKCGFAFSTWQKNKYRENEYLKENFSKYEIVTKAHFYHLGAKESLRNEIIEALVIQNGFLSIGEKPYKEPVQAYAMSR